MLWSLEDSEKRLTRFVARRSVWHLWLSRFGTPHQARMCQMHIRPVDELSQKEVRNQTGRYSEKFRALLKQTGPSFSKAVCFLGVPVPCGDVHEGDHREHLFLS